MILVTSRVDVAFLLSLVLQQPKREMNFCQLDCQLTGMTVQEHILPPSLGCTSCISAWLLVVSVARKMIGPDG